MKQFVIGDIHGGHKALVQCFDRSGFDLKNDELFVIGDVVDGWAETRQVIDELMKIKKVTLIMGNHDVWAIKWGRNTGYLETIWIDQGGFNTVKSYNPDLTKDNFGYMTLEPMPKEHLDFLLSGVAWLEDEEHGRLFVHGGFDPNKPIEKQSYDYLMWDRTLLEFARYKGNQSFKYGGYEDVFVGHTSTLYYRQTEPTHYCNVWNLDTGAGWSGRLSIMDLESKEVWQSDQVKTLYPDEEHAR